MSTDKSHRKFKNLLLDRRFQLKYTLAVVIISAGVSVVLGVFLYRTQQEVFDANRENSQLLAMADQEIDAAMQAELARADQRIQQRNRELMLTLVGSLGALVLMLSLLGIVATHKIAGPAYAMRKVMAKIADGRHPRVRPLRKGDELRAVAEELKRMADNLRQREERDVAGLQQTLEALKQTPNPPKPITAWMEQIIAEKQQRLSEDS